MDVSLLHTFHLGFPTGVDNTATRVFLAPLPGCIIFSKWSYTLPLYFLCYCFFLVTFYFALFCLFACSKNQKPKKIRISASSLFLVLLSCLSFCLVRMSSSTPLVMSPESEVLTFKQRGGESLKDAWERISDAHKKIQPIIALSVLLRCFYFGIFTWYRHALDLIAGGLFGI